MPDDPWETPNPNAQVAEMRRRLALWCSGRLAEHDIVAHAIARRMRGIRDLSDIPRIVHCGALYKDSDGGESLAIERSILMPEERTSLDAWVERGEARLGAVDLGGYGRESVECYIVSPRAFI